MRLYRLFSTCSSFHFACVALLAGVLLATHAVPQAAHAQQGSGEAETGAVAGVVVDGANGETLPGANVRVAGTQRGTSTGVEGRYRIEGLAPGTYDVEFSFVGYQPKTVTGVEVAAGETATLDVTLSAGTEQLDEVVVTAEVARDTEAGLLRERQGATAVSNAISAEAISASGSSTAAGAMEKVTGVSVVEGRYVNVRGLQGRYVNARLNGSQLPSSDPDGNSVALDIFPANLIDNIVVTKTFTPDQAGNFTGGSIDISTKSFPEEFFLNLAVSGSYNTEAGFGEDILLPADGLEEIPEGAPTRSMAQDPVLLDNDVEAGKLDAAARAFATPFSPAEETAWGGRSIEFSAGNQFAVLGGRRLGAIASVSYDRSFSGYSNGTTARFQQTGIASETLNPNAEFESRRGRAETLVGGLVGLALRLSPAHEIETRFLYNTNRAEEARYETGRLQRDLTGNQRFQTRALGVTERSVLSGELSGTHQFGSGPHAVRAEWDASLSETQRHEPDQRFFSNQFTVSDAGADTSYAISPSIYLAPSRFFRDLSEQSASGSFSVAVPLGEATLKTGGKIRQRSRSFRERRFAHLADESNFAGRLNAYVSRKAGLISSENGGYQFGTYVADRSQPSNNYDGEQDIWAGFGMVELPVPGLPRLEFIGGLRVEGTDMTVERTDGEFTGGFNTVDWLPSANLVWSLRDDMNVRASYGRTIARPSFREVAPFSSFNFVSDYIEVGNPDLTRTRVHNFDLRWEWFMRGGEVLSVGGFYKAFDDPIERTIDPRAAGSDVQIEYLNKSSAQVAGIELEARKRLGGVADWLQHVQVGANLTLIRSAVERDSLELAAIRAFDDDAGATRPLQGQSPYVANLNAGYENPGTGTSVNVFFNRFGPRLNTVTRNGLDLYERPRNMIDVTASQRLTGGLTWKASVKNILNAEYVLSQEFQGQEFVNDRYGLGLTVSTGFSYSF